MAKRIRAIVESRKPFVVTIDYVGPDRRDADRSPRNVERITVPNALRAKVRRDPEAAASPAAIESALKRITRARALSFDLGIGILISLIVDGGKRDRPARALVRLHKVGKLVSELQNLVMRGDFVDALPSCASLSKLVRELVESGGEIARGARQTLEERAMALHLCFNPGKTVSAIGAEIDTAVERFRRHNREQPA